MMFESTRVEPAGKEMVKIHGHLTIRDVTKPVVLDACHLGSSKLSSSRPSRPRSTRSTLATK